MKIVTVTSNPAIDSHVVIPGFQALRENFAPAATRISGGKGVNISRALLSYGDRPLTMVLTGEKNADAFLSDLSALAPSVMKTEGEIRENLTVHADAGETRISLEGFSGSDALLEAWGDFVARSLSPSDFSVIAGSLFGGVSDEAKLRFVRKMKEKGAFVAIDSRSYGRELLFKAAPFLIKPNEEEIEVLAPGLSASEAALSLHLAGIENVLLTLGGGGAILACREGVFRAEAPKISVVSTIGAGDSTVGGFLYALKSGKSKREALALAMAFGSAACLTEGTLPPKKEDIDRLASMVTVE